MSTPNVEDSLFWDSESRPATSSASSTAASPENEAQTALLAASDTDSLFDPPAYPEGSLSRLEAILTSYPTILESLIAQLPTPAVFALYHTSKHLRDFLQIYPLAWRTLSFRLPQPALVLNTPGNEPVEGRERQSRPYALDALLKHIVQPYGTRLTSLDLCNTAVSGVALVASILVPRKDTLKHLSVRGCKNVSIKYHVVPFLEPYTHKDSPWSTNELALRSLYAYRCRHHRRRPYLPSSLLRRDSDTDPTHQLIEICHQLGIWTDTAWCPTPGWRCFRRKDYHQGRVGPGNMEVWMPFDRLWRSSNRLGPTDGTQTVGPADGRLWEISETGQDGEPLGTGGEPFKGEGKHIPAHLRQSHKIFIEDIKCAQCNDTIRERCESCSVRMHCMGCRKTLCASCAFNRPIPRKRVKTRHFASLAFGNQASSSNSANSKNKAPPPPDRFWWAPGATRSPNLMNELSNEDDSSDSEDANVNNGPPAPLSNPPKLNMSWCCLEPIFSGGGGIAVLGTGLGGKGADKIRAAPLPRAKQYEDPDFMNQLRPVDYVRELKNNGLYEYVLGEDIDILSYLKQDSLDLQAQSCPRGLCQECYRSFRWKVACRGCKKPLCKEHDFRGLKIRKCGFRDLSVERQYVQTHDQPTRLAIPAFNSDKSVKPDAQELSADSSSAQGELSPLSQSQILVSPSPTASLNNSTPSPTISHASIDPVASSSSLNKAHSSYRPRSFSASGVRNRNLGSWTSSPFRTAPPITNSLPLPCHPRHPVQWEGCGAYFCQSPRPVGDARARCPALLRECSECQVLVCESCANSHQRCNCTFCTTHYHCPHCVHKKKVKAQCRFEEELKLKREAELKTKERMEKEKEMREKADELVEASGQFWLSLLGEVLEEIAAGPSDIGTASENPNDKITVTTEFGVAHEPSNLTVISAATGSNAVPLGPLGHESNSPSDSNSNSAPDGMTDNQQGVSLIVDVTPEEESDEDAALLEFEFDDGDEADGEDDDLDAESAFIDEFLDPVEEVPLAGYN